MKKRMKIVLIIIIFAGLLSGYLIWGNSSVGVTEYTASPQNLPESFEGFRIVQVSDLHNDKFSGLLKKVSSAKPDIIVLTGDLIDFYETDIPVAVEFAKNVVEIAPVYYVSGNHEYRTGQYDILRAQLIDAGVKVLESETLKINRNGEEISITGINDPTFFGSGEDNAHMDAFSKELRMLADGADSSVNILLSHIPQILPLYAECGFDLVFTGHAHGGQFRLPIIGGFFAPGQGWWPDYTEGMHVSGNTHMIISRGLGNSAFPLRLFNRPELVVCELRGETK